MIRIGRDSHGLPYAGFFFVSGSKFKILLSGIYLWVEFFVTRLPYTYCWFVLVRSWWLKRPSVGQVGNRTRVDLGSQVQTYCGIDRFWGHSLNRAARNCLGKETQEQMSNNYPYITELCITENMKALIPFFSISGVGPLHSVRYRPPDWLMCPGKAMTQWSETLGCGLTGSRNIRCTAAAQ